MGFLVQLLVHMSIKDFSIKIKPFWGEFMDRLHSIKNGLKLKEDLLIILLIILVGTASFGLGKLSAHEKQKTPITITKGLDTAPQAQKVSAVQAQGIVFASKTGTKYYYPSCSSSVKEENKVWFNSIEEATAVGLTLASGCKK